MVLRPTTLPMWAEQDVISSESGQYNVVEPPPEKQLAGWSYHELPPRQWFNWLARYTYRWLNYLRQQENQSVVTTNAAGIGLFPTPPVGFGMCILYAVDVAVPANYIYAIGSNLGGTINFNVIDSNVLTIPANPITGPNVPVSGGSGPNNVIIYGQTKAVAIA